MSDIRNTYRLVGADLTDFDLRPDGNTLMGHGSMIDYDVAIELALNKDDALLHYSTTIGIRGKGEPEVMSNARVVSVFQIFDLAKYVEINEPDQFSVSQELNLSMGRVAIGLTRGLLVARFKESGFPSIILPLLPFEY